jgi:hypothetical protein
MKMRDLQTKANRVVASLAWRKPAALWFLPLIFLFIFTTLPLLSERGLWPFTTHFFNGLLLMVMSLVLVHNFFGFIHRMERTDFYFSLPSNRTKLFAWLNLSALAHLAGPSLVIMGLNTLLASLLPHTEPGWYAYIPSPAGIWTSYAGLLIRIFYFFFLLEVCYLITEKALTALGFFAMLNIIWPLMLFSFSDATSQFLPGLINPLVTALEEPSSLQVALFQLFSPAIFTGGLAHHHLPLALMTLGMASLAFCLFRARQAGYSSGQGSVNWPFRLIQWMGVITLSLLGGYGAHYLRVWTTDSEFTPVNLSPAPFLIGTSLGFFLSLWVFNLVGNKGKIRWRPMVAAALAAALPYAVWLCIVMTGAGGFSTRLPEAGSLKRAGIYYPGAYFSPFGRKESRPFLLELTTEQDLVLLAEIYRSVLSPDNPGLDLPRTLSSKGQSRDFVRLKNPFILPYGENEIYYPHLPETRLILETKDGRSYGRSLTLPLYANNPDYLQLLRQNDLFFMAELSDYAVADKFHLIFSLEAAPHVSAADKERWIDPLIAAGEEDDYPFESLMQDMTHYIALSLGGQDDRALAGLVAKAPCLIHVSLELPTGAAASGDQPAITLPVDPERVPGLRELIDQALEIYEMVTMDPRNAGEGRPVFD